MKIKFATILLIAAFLQSCSNRPVTADSKSENKCFDVLNSTKNRMLSYNDRLKYTSQCLNLLSFQLTDTTTLRKFIPVADNFYRLNAAEKLKETNKIFLAKSIAGKSIFYTGMAYRWKGIYYESQSINDSAFYFYLKAEKLFRELNKTESICQILQDQAQVKYYVNDYLGAEHSLTKALNISMRYKLTMREFSQYLFLGNISLELNEYNKSLSYTTKALRILSKNPKQIPVQNFAFCMNDLGRYYNNIGNYKLALKYLEKGLKTRSLCLNSPECYAWLLDNYGNAQLLSGNYTSLPQPFLEAKALREKMHINIGKNFNSLFISRYYRAIGNQVQAKYYANEAYELSKSFKAPNDMLISLKQLIEVAPDHAEIYAEKYIKLSDSMQFRERESRNKFAKIAFETEEIRNDKEKAERQKQYVLWAVELLFIIAILILVFWIQTSIQRKIKIATEQQNKDHQIYQIIQGQQSKIDEARQTVKKRIAMDLHDGVMNSLAAIRINLQVMINKTFSETREQLNPIVSKIQVIEKEVRDIAHGLNESLFADFGSFPAILTTLCTEQQVLQKGKCYIEIDKGINWDLVTSSKKIHLYRILQEAVTNCRKHSHAQNIIISISKNESNMLLEVYDDGIGFSDKKNKRGTGLKNISERVKSLNGTFNIISKENEATTLRLKIPY